MAILFGLITLVGWGVGDVFVTFASRRVGSYSSYFWALALGLSVVSFYIPFAGPIASWEFFLLAFTLNIIHTIGNLAYFKGLEVGNASLVGTLAGAFTIICVLISIIIFGEKLTVFQLIGIIFAIVGVLLASFKIENNKGIIREALSDKGVVFGLISLICWGIYFGFIRIPAEQIGWFWAAYPMYLQIIFLPFLSQVRSDWRRIFKDKLVFLILLGDVVFINSGDFSYNAGILSGYTSIVAPIAGSSPVLFAILARIFFKDRLSRQQLAGIVMTLAGIVVIGLSSV
jgi:drug/metabolite transporter (DMT)-like permease